MKAQYVRSLALEARAAGRVSESVQWQHLVLQAVLRLQGELVDRAAVNGETSLVIWSYKLAPSSEGYQWTCVWLTFFPGCGRTQLLKPCDFVKVSQVPTVILSPTCHPFNDSASVQALNLLGASGYELQLRHNLAEPDSSYDLVLTCVED